MNFTFTGFTQEAGFRLFAFEVITVEKTKTRYRVKVDTSLLGKYGIKVQELPLLCRRLLDKHENEKDISTSTLIFTEAEMCLQQSERAAILNANALKKKAMHRPPSAAGVAWRTSPSK